MTPGRGLGGRAIVRRRSLPSGRAVLIVAFLGAALYLIFRQILTSSGSKASTTVDNIGTGG
jgi:hypothetical protein